MLDKIFSGSVTDTSRFSVPGLIVMVLGVILNVISAKLAGGTVGKRYYILKIASLLLVMAGALITVKLF